MNTLDHVVVLCFLIAFLSGLIAFLSVLIDLYWLIPNNIRLETRVTFVPYDLWVGIFISVEKRRVYFLPVPCFEIVVSVVPR